MPLCTASLWFTSAGSQVNQTQIKLIKSSPRRGTETENPCALVKTKLLKLNFSLIWCWISATQTPVTAHTDWTPYSKKPCECLDGTLLTRCNIWLWVSVSVPDEPLTSLYTAMYLHYRFCIIMQLSVSLSLTFPLAIWAIPCYMRPCEMIAELL